jgi:hypothetical protein
MLRVTEVGQPLVALRSYQVSYNSASWFRSCLWETDIQIWRFQGEIQSSGLFSRMSLPCAEAVMFASNIRKSRQLFICEKCW